MGERLIAVPCAGGALTPHNARVQTPRACLHEAVVVTDAAGRVIFMHAAAPRQAVLREPALRRRDVHHPINHDCQTRASLLALHADALEDPRALVALEDRQSQPVAQDDHGLADASRPTRAMAPACGQARPIPAQ